jgi:tRNA pseudouridine55 synthase
VSRRPARAGGLLLDKPVGPTSHDMVASARRTLGIRRVGHTGTLDPFASGLLLLLVGPATRLAEYLAGLPKEYRAEALLGRRTTTDDPEGETLSETSAWKGLRADRVEEVLRGFQGEVEQVPPDFSAKKQRGTAAYVRARRGDAVALEPVRVLIHEIEVEEVALPRVSFRVVC